MAPVQRSTYKVFNPQGLKFLTQLRLGLSHLNEHRFIHNFKDCISPSSSEVENKLTVHCLDFSTLHRLSSFKVMYEFSY